MGVGQVLTGLWLRNDRFHDAKQVLKIENNALVPDGSTTTRSVTSVSVGVQPVYFVTDRLHTALDLNRTYKSQKTDANDFESMLITPIVRYSLDKSSIGNPQIYTSLTYGTYDWKAKKGADGAPTNRLVTTQSGFECWF